jgi:hypothetical protein
MHKIRQQWMILLLTQSSANDTLIMSIERQRASQLLDYCIQGLRKNMRGCINISSRIINPPTLGGGKPMRKSTLLVLIGLLVVVMVAAPVFASATNNVMVKPEGDESPPGTRQTCPTNTVFGQEPYDPSNPVWSGWSSDTGPPDGPYLVHDNFTNADGTNRIRFWGLRAYNDGSNWSTCTEDPMPFEITFYSDAAGQPGAVIATYNVSLSGTGTGIFFATSFELFEWETALSPAPPVGVSPGWVSVQGSGDPNCWFLWMSSPDGDLSAFQWDGSSMNQLGEDLAFCLIVDPVECEWNEGDPHKMHFPQLPDELGWDVNATAPLVLADDFLCTETGYVRDFHFWGSWRHGIEGQILTFVLSLHEDITAEQNPDGYSKPGATLWELEVSDFGFVPIDPPSMEGWYDPSTDEFFPDDHQAYFQYNICIDEALAFFQEEGTIYWLNVSAVIEDPTATQWGWKSTLDHWNDDAVWAFWGDLNWQEIYEPGDAVFSQFWMALDATGQIVPPLSGGITPFDDGTGINGWYFYPDVEPPFYNIWFYDHPFDPERIKTAHIEFDLFPFEPGPAYLVFVVNYTTDLFPPGNPEPPLPGSPPEWTGRDTLWIFEGEEGHFIFDWTLPDYNPEWVSIDVWGWNYIIPEGSAFIEHRCRPSLDLSFVITTEALEGACCYDPAGGGLDATCIVTTQADCETNLGGVYQGDGTMCAGTEACCLPDGTCLDADALCCVNVFGGAPQGPGTACTATEACCFADGSCADLDPLCCANLGGTAQGPGTACGPTEACCFPDGSCQDIDPICCDDLGGTAQGPGTACSGTTEACCFTDGSCLDAEPNCCIAMGGTPQGMGTICLGDNNGNNIDDACEDDEGACCFDDGSCLVLTEADCVAQSGTYKGDGTVCLGDNNGNGVDDICESWVPGDGHKMHHPQLPNPWGWDVMATEPIVLADDWMCSETGPVKDIHFWGSWKDGTVGDIQFFLLSIHEDIPADQSPTGYSMPGALLWEEQVDFFNATMIEPGAFEGWYNPETGEQLQNNHTEYFQYDVILPEILWFQQEQGTIYWLNIMAVLADPINTQWGWKSTLDNWNDDAVWGTYGVYDWTEMYEPPIGNYVQNHFMAALGPGGELLYGEGENAYGDGWYFYPEDSWWNIWFYDHPFSYDRFKDFYIEFDAFQMEEPSYLEVAFNWSTDLWTLEQPEDSMPPLPGVDETLYIGRYTVLATQNPDGHYMYNFPFDEYNPEWVSVDIRGTNVDIPFGFIVHNCLPRMDQSLDLAFVITGGEPCDCEPGNANGDPTTNISDAVYIISYIFGGGPAPTPYPICSGDANCDCITNITDAVFLITYIFGGGPAPCDCLTWLSICGPPLR